MSGAAADSDDLAFEYVHDPHDPDAFLVRCTECVDDPECAGEWEYSNRGDAHSKADSHGLNCAPTGVTPVSSKRVATDGGQPERDRETKTFHRAVCPSCGSENGLNRPSTLPIRANVDRKIHNGKHHSGAPVAEVESFEAEAVGVVPADTPLLPGEEVDA